MYFLFTALIWTVLLSTFPTLAQESVKPTVLRRVYSEKIRDAKLEAAILAAVETGNGRDGEARYYYNRVDLDGDKKPEVLVYVFGRLNCGTGGCGALLFRKVEDKYELITNFEPVRNPIIVSQNKTNGWHDLIFFNRGGGIIPGYYSVCRFNGRTYPDNPTVEQDAPPLKTGVKGTAYLAGVGDGKSGLPFRRGK